MRCLERVWEGEVTGSYFGYFDLTHLEDTVEWEVKKEGLSLQTLHCSQKLAKEAEKGSHTENRKTRRV